jgi:hypothetical protein
MNMLCKISTAEYSKWLESVLRRDGRRCRVCGKTENLQVHHIIPMSLCQQIALLPMNGVTLCRDDHYQYDEVWQGRRFDQGSGIGKTFALMFTIPHKFQAYETVGNWQILPDGTPVVFVSDMKDWRYNFLVMLHEFVEVFLCRHSGISQKQVDRFDIAYEKNRPEGNEDEPGDDPRAPYRVEHCIATGIERIAAGFLGVSWKEYEQAINELS